MRHFSGIFFILLLGFTPANSSAATGEEEEFDALHHTEDGYYMDFEPFGKVELPRMFLVRDSAGEVGLRLYAGTAAALRSGEFVAGGEHGKEDDSEHAAGDAAQESSVEALIASGKHLDAQLEPASGSVMIDLSVTRHLVFAMLAAGMLLTLFLNLAGRYNRGVGRTSAPRGIVQNLFETLVVFVRDDIARPNLGEDRYRKFLPFLLTLFFFVLTCNLLGLVPYGATATSNIMVTSVLATCTFFLTQFNASRDHWQHVFWPPNMPILVKFMLIPTEIMGLFIKPIALAIRLFANMTAGHLVILSLIGMIFMLSQQFGPAAGYGVVPASLAFTLFVYLLEILIAFIQAYIFTILSALFIGMAIAEHEHEETHEHAPEAAGA